MPIPSRPAERWQRPRRFRYPHQDITDAKIEPITQPLYSYGVYDAAAMAGQRDLQFFRYAVGGQVAGLPAADGTVPATDIHTNMTQPNLLSVPKVMLITGVRVVVPNLDSLLTAVIDDSASENETPDNSNLIQDLQRILYGTFFRLFIGTKDYIKCPTYALPGNAGIGGIAATAISSLATTGPFQAAVNYAGSAGREYGLGAQPILIPSQQNFNASIHASQTTPPTLSAERGVYVFLDGVFGREVM